jgi:hypothetical protein
LVVALALPDTTDSTRSLGAMVVVVGADDVGATTVLNVSSSRDEPQLVARTTAGAQ